MTTTITYTTGDATIVPPYSIIAHICNNRGGWGKGFSGALSRRYPQAEETYRYYWRNQVNCALGCIQCALCGNKRVIFNLIAQDGYSTKDKPAIDYVALRMCLVQLCNAMMQDFPGHTIHMPRIGTGLAGGEWSVIEPMIVEELCSKGVQVTVYDWEEKK